MSTKYERERLAQFGAYLSEPDPRYVINFKKRKEPPKEQLISVTKAKKKRKVGRPKKKKSIWDKFWG